MDLIWANSNFLAILSKVEEKEKAPEVHFMISFIVFSWIFLHLLLHITTEYGNIWAILHRNDNLSAQLPIFQKLVALKRNRLYMVSRF